MSAEFVTGVISFPGVTAPQSATVMRVNGVKPGVAIIYAQPQPGTPNTSGTATFRFGTSTNTLTWTNALCESGTIQVTARGHRQIFYIYDRRWRWSKATVTGAYNVRDASGAILSSTEKTLAELATILFTAMGEPSADVSAITSTEKPETVWDHDQADDEVVELLEKRGYVISLQVDNTVKVYVKGTGAVLPDNDDVVNANVSIDPPEVPETLRVVGNHTLVQSMLRLIPVGLDTDGSIKEVRYLSYNPGGVGNETGWDHLDLLKCAYITDPKAQKLAVETVGKWYEVVSQADETFDLTFEDVNYCPDEIEVTDASQYLPLKPMLLTSNPTPLGKDVYDHAYLSGTVWITDSNPPANTPPFTRIDKTYYSWKLHGDLGIVEFRVKDVEDIPLKYTSDVQTFADLYITCTYSVHDNDSYVKDRYVRDLNMGGFGLDSTKINELQRTLIASYAAGTATVSGLADSAPDTYADEILSTMEKRYATTVANVLLYRDIYSFNTDGVCWQLQWNVATQGGVPFCTMVSQNAEMLPLLPTGKQLEQARAARRTATPTNRRNRNYKTNMFGRQMPGGGFP